MHNWYYVVSRLLYWHLWSVSSPPVLGRPLQVRHFTFSWNCASSAAQQCRRAILHPFEHRASQGAFRSDLTHWSQLQHNWCRLKEITAVRFAQSTKLTSKYFLRESVYFNYLDCFAISGLTLIWLIVLISQSSSENLKCSLCIFLFRSFLRRRPLERLIFLPYCLSERISWAKISAFMWEIVEDQTIYNWCDKS